MLQTQIMPHIGQILPTYFRHWNSGAIQSTHLGWVGSVPYDPAYFVGLHRPPSPNHGDNTNHDVSPSLHHHAEPLTSINKIRIHNAMETSDQCEQVPRTLRLSLD